MFSRLAPWSALARSRLRRLTLAAQGPQASENEDSVIVIEGSLETLVKTNIFTFSAQI